MNKARVEVALVIAALCLSGAALAQSQAPSAGVRLQAGMAKENVDGDLKAAIDIYQKVAADKSAPRDVRARALMLLAGCYEKQGQQAEQVYLQVAREYADQPAAAQARTKLAALRQAAAPVAMTLRKIEPVPGAAPTYNADGQRAVYLDTAANVLVIGDLAGKSKSVIYKVKPGESLTFAPSRDFSMVSLRLSGPGARITNAVIKADGTGYRELYQGNPNGQVRPWSWEWSWDNRYLVIAGVGPAGVGSSESSSGGGVAVVSVSDGKSREVVRREDRVEIAVPSPDSRFIAFTETKGTARRIFVVPFQGGEPRLVSEETAFPGMLDWTPDGRFLVITREQSETEALYLLPVKDGQPAGDPVFVRYGSFLYGTMHPNGSLSFRSIRTGSSAAMLAPLDSNGRLGAWKPLDLNIVGNAGVNAVWSPDSTQIVYPSRHDDAGQSGGAVRIRNIVTGQDREVYRTAAGSSICMWEARRPNLLCLDLNGSEGELSLVALDSGHVERLGSVPSSQGFSAVEQFSREKGIEPVLPEWTFALVRLVDRNLEFRSTQESEWKRLATLNSPRREFGAEIAYSSHGVFYIDKDSAGKDGLFRIPLEGGQPERLGDPPLQSDWGRSIDVSPDGRNILVEGFVGGGRDETWLLENFVPKPPAAR